MTEVFRRIMLAKIDSKKSWNEIAHEAGVKVASWMTGIPTSHPTDEDLKKIAPVLNTTFEWLKYGQREEKNEADL